jgi:polar amino acid transport system substrate-binding protein
MRTRRLLVGVAAVMLLAGCGEYADTAVPQQDEAAAPSLPEPAAPQSCGDPTRSYAPDGSVDDLRSGAVAELRQRDRLVVGVSADSYLLGSNNPFTGQIEGFDIDLAEAIADAIWDDDKDHVQLRVITAADRIPLLQDQETGVDIVARNMTINCDRWEQIAFSAEYYRAGQKVLVRKDLAEEGVDTARELAGLRVCAPDGTTSLANILAESPEVEAVTAANHTGCLAKLQRGEADAITGDDTVLAGLAAQDPYAVVPEQDAFTAEPYGIAVNAENEDLVRFINAVLEEMRADGSWQDSYDKWLRPTLGEGTGQPRPVYGRS